MTARAIGATILLLVGLWTAAMFYTVGPAGTLLLLILVLL